MITARTAQPLTRLFSTASSSGSRGARAVSSPAPHTCTRTRDASQPAAPSERAQFRACLQSKRFTQQRQPLKLSWCATFSAVAVADPPGSGWPGSAQSACCRCGAALPQKWGGSGGRGARPRPAAGKGGTRQQLERGGLKKTGPPRHARFCLQGADAPLHHLLTRTCSSAA